MVICFIEKTVQELLLFQESFNVSIYGVVSIKNYLLSTLLFCIYFCSILLVNGFLLVCKGAVVKLFSQSDFSLVVHWLES